MRTEDIKQLLEKYYEGETSPAEEQILLEYFESDQVDSVLAEEGDVFISLHSQDSIEVPETLEEELSSLIDDLEAKEETKHYSLPLQPKKTNRFVLWAASIAACTAILVSVFFVVNKPQQATPQPMAMHDTYTDPAEAYEEAEKALSIISLNFNKGLSKLSDANQQMSDANEIVSNSLNNIKTK